MTNVDPNYLRNEQYKDSGNLAARANLHNRFGTNLRPFQLWVFDQILAANLPADAKILECGAGPAWLWRENIKRVPMQWQVTLTDFSSGMVEEQRSALGEALPKFHFDVVDIQQIPFEAEQFDAVIANHMLYHVPNVPQALSEVTRVLKRGGMFFAATNGAQHLRELDQLVKQLWPNINIWTGFRTPSFALEDGANLLQPYFSSIDIQRYKNLLKVTDADALADYILSSKIGKSLSVNEVAALRPFIHAQVERRGGTYEIRSDTGLFVTRK